MKKEQTIQSEIIKHLESIGCYVVKTVSVTKSGVPDLIVLHPVKGYVAIEVKTEIGRVSELQQANIDRINGKGGIAFVARSVDDVKARI